MGISISEANARARELRNQAQNLRNAKSNMISYKAMFGVSWQGREIPFYLEAIRRVELRLSQVAHSLETLADSIEMAAYQIRQEEIEEEQKRYQEWLEEQMQKQQEIVTRK